MTPHPRLCPCPICTRDAHAKEMAAMEASRDAALARAGVLEAAARTLVERLDFVHAHPNYQGVWMMAGIHSYPYTGPIYIDELAALKAALSSPPPPCLECDGTKLLNLSLDGRSGPNIPCPECSSPPPHDGEGA